MPERDAKIKELRTKATAAEQTVLGRNIYYRATLDNLVTYERAVTRIAGVVGVKVKQLLSETGVKSPIELLEIGIQHWDQILEAVEVPSDEELVAYLNQQFQVRVLRVATVLPPDEAGPIMGETEEGGSTPEVREDADRVKMALKTILHLDINGSHITLDDLEISISELPSGTSRKKSYWILNIKKFNIAVLVNNQYGNRTFVVSYNSPEELENLGTKITTKTRAGKGEIIHHFKYHNEAQFAEDLLNAISRSIEKKGIKKMDEAYFRNPENVRNDLQAFVDDLVRKNHKIVKRIEDLSTFSLAKAVATCANGEEKKGETYIMTAGVQLKMAKGTVEARKMQGAILDALKKIIGIEVVKFPPMDEAYFNNKENVEHDLKAYVAELQKKPEYKDRVLTIADLNTLNFFGLPVVCRNGESVSGHTYIQRAGIGLKMAKTATQADKNLGEILIALKRKAGIEVVTFSKMDKQYFNDSKNVKKDLEAFVSALQIAGVKGIQTIKNLSTYNLRPAEIVAANGEEINGQIYLRRACIAFGFFDRVDHGRHRIKSGQALAYLIKKAEEADVSTPPTSV
ncbi:MAG: hypothetical protein WC285_02300 [Candidatus Gracilibacteria bacterium]|jgi:hypothetical protein